MRRSRTVLVPALLATLIACAHDSMEVPMSKIPAPIGWKRSAYYELRNEHKRPRVDGPRAGWTLAVRKADGCLLVIESRTTAPPRRQWTVREISLEESGRFDDAQDPEILRGYLAEHIEDREAIEAILARKDACTLGYRLLVDEPDDDSG